MSEHLLAPELQVSQWFNCERALDLRSLRGRVVVLHAFQMLCPGCVLHAVPQAERLHRTFADEAVTVIGLHTVFEHHEAMPPASLHAFLHEFGVTHPVGVDATVPGHRIPATMQAYAMRGTPTLVLIDRSGHIQGQQFGQVDDMALAASVMRLARQAESV